MTRYITNGRLTTHVHHSTTAQFVVIPNIVSFEEASRHRQFRAYGLDASQLLAVEYRFDALYGRMEPVQKFDAIVCKIPKIVPQVVKCFQKNQSFFVSEIKHLAGFFSSVCGWLF
jgi:hypothetical protein